MASDFQRPSNLMVSLSMLAQSNAVAPPGRRLRALSKAGSMSVRWRSQAALVRRAVVTRV